MVRFYKIPKWLLVTADCVTLTPLPSPRSPLTYPSPIISHCRHGDPVYLCKWCHEFSTGERCIFYDDLHQIRKWTSEKERWRTARKVQETFSRSMKLTCGLQLQAPSSTHRGLILGNKLLYIWKCRILTRQKLFLQDWQFGATGRLVCPVQREIQ